MSFPHHAHHWDAPQPKKQQRINSKRPRDEQHDALLNEPCQSLKRLRLEGQDGKVVPQTDFTATCSTDQTDDIVMVPMSEMEQTQHQIPGQDTCSSPYREEQEEETKGPATDYAQVNHLLGGLHHERQQRLSSSAATEPRRRTSEEGSSHRPHTVKLPSDSQLY